MGNESRMIFYANIPDTRAAHQASRATIRYICALSQTIDFIGFLNSSFFDRKEQIL